MPSKKLYERLRKKDRRTRFVENQIRIGVPFQVRALRDKKGWSQEKLGQLAGMAQTAVSRIENESAGTRLTIKTLLKLAAVFDVALVVRFVSFRELVHWVAGEPYTIAGLSQRETTAPKSFEEEDFTRTPSLIDEFTAASVVRNFTLIFRVADTRSRFEDYTDRPIHGTGVVRGRPILPQHESEDEAAERISTEHSEVATNWVSEVSRILDSTIPGRFAR